MTASGAMAFACRTREEKSDGIDGPSSRPKKSVGLFPALDKPLQSGQRAGRPAAIGKAATRESLP